MGDGRHARRRFPRGRYKREVLLFEVWVQGRTVASPRVREPGCCWCWVRARTAIVGVGADDARERTALSAA